MAGLSSSTGIEQYLRSREELVDQVGVLRLADAAAAAKVWREMETAETLDTSQDSHLKGLLERFERVTGRPLAQACPPRCSCRGVPDRERVPVG